MEPVNALGMTAEQADAIYYFALTGLLYCVVAVVALRILFAVFPASRDWPFKG